ncbi:hypothetical protein [Methylorubrum sp. DB1722]|uniref:hypothetical protein n=1 Tax=Methylorubrum sp. DB1722 TaxID=2478916 RepID=UPI0018E3A01F|nr:hypothetical protein [Methylorubrum sp. DB1722]MBI1689534.1 hypothetical protein [Methylorubrum sp. DB1722]
MAGTMRREVADIRTRFSVVGLDAVANGFRSTARVLADATRLSRSTGAAAQGGAAAAAAASNTIANASRTQAAAAQAAARQSIAAARQEAQERETAAKRALEAAEEQVKAEQRRLKGIRTNRFMDAGARQDVLAQRAAARDQIAALRDVARVRAAAYQEELRRSRERITAAEREARETVRAAERADRQAGASDEQLTDTVEENARERAAAEHRVEDAVAKTGKAVHDQEKAVGKLGPAFRTVGAAASKALLTIGKIGLAAGIGAGGLAIGKTAAFYGLSDKATARASDYVRQSYNTSLSTGFDTPTFNALASAAEREDIDRSDLRGSFIQFQGQVRAASQDPEGDLAKTFEKMGVSLKDANGRLRTTKDLLGPVVKGLQTLDTTERAVVSSNLFGEDDAGKLIPFFRRMAENPNLLRDARERQGKLGTAYGAEDLERARAYKQAVDDMAAAWDGVSIAVATAVGPDVTSLLQGAAFDLARNRIAIAVAFKTAAVEMGRITRDVSTMIFGGRAYDPMIQNRWLLPLRDGLIIAGQAAMTATRFIREAYNAAIGDDAYVTEFPWLLTLRDGLATAYTWISSFARSAWATVTFQDYNVDTGFAWMIVWRDKVVGVVQSVKDTWADLQQVWAAGGNEAQPTTGAGTMLAGLLKGFEDARTYLQRWQTWFKNLGADIALVWSQIGNADKDKSGFKFEWMKELSDKIWFVADAAKQGWDWFKAFYEKIFDFVSWATGMNFESILFFVAFLKFTGTLGALKTALDLVMKPLKWIAGILGLAGAAGGGAGAGAAAGGAAAAAVAALKLALEGLLGTLAAIAASPVWIAIIGGVLGGAALATALKDTWIGERIRDFAGWMNNENDSPGLKAIRAAGENPTVEEQARRERRLSMTDVERWQAEEAARKAQFQAQAASSASAQAAQPTWMNATFAPPGTYAPQAQPAPEADRPVNNVTIVLPTGDSIEARQTGSQYDDTMRKLWRR